MKELLRGRRMIVVLNNSKHIGAQLLRRYLPAQLFFYRNAIFRRHPTLSPIPHGGIGQRVTIRKVPRQTLGRRSVPAQQVDCFVCNSIFHASNTKRFV